MKKDREGLTFQFFAFNVICDPRITLGVSVLCVTHFAESLESGNVQRLRCNVALSCDS